VKIGQVDTEIALLIVKNKQKYIALPASLPSGLIILILDIWDENFMTTCWFSC